MQLPMTSPVPEKILRLARAVREAGGRALLVGGCVRDRLMGRGGEGLGRGGLRRRARAPARAARALRPRQRRRRGVHRLQARSATWTSRSRAASARPGRGHRAFYIEGDPHMSVRGGRAPPRLHRQRHPRRPARRRDHRPLRRPRRHGGANSCAPSRPRPSSKTPCACCAPRSSPRASGSTVEEKTVELCRSIDLTDLPRRARLGRAGEDSPRRRASPRSASAGSTRLGVDAAALPRTRRAQGRAAGVRVAPRGRCVTSHTSRLRPRARVD